MSFAKCTAALLALVLLATSCQATATIVPTGVTDRAATAPSQSAPPDPAVDDGSQSVPSEADDTDGAPDTDDTASSNTKDGPDAPDGNASSANTHSESSVPAATSDSPVIAPSADRAPLQNVPEDGAAAEALAAALEVTALPSSEEINGSAADCFNSGLELRGTIGYDHSLAVLIDDPAAVFDADTLEQLVRVVPGEEREYGFEDPPASCVTVQPRSDLVVGCPRATIFETEEDYRDEPIDHQTLEIRIFNRDVEAAGSAIEYSRVLFVNACGATFTEAEFAALPIGANGHRISPSRLSPSNVKSTVRAALAYFRMVRDDAPLRDEQCHGLTASATAFAAVLAAGRTAFDTDRFGFFSGTPAEPNPADIEALKAMWDRSDRVGLHLDRALPYEFFDLKYPVGPDTFGYGRTFMWSDMRWSESPWQTHAVLHAEVTAGIWHGASGNEQIRRMIEVRDAGCTDEQRALPAETYAGFQPFDAETSDPSYVCGRLAASYALRFDFRQYLGLDSADQAGKRQNRATNLYSDLLDWHEIEPFFPLDGFGQFINNEGALKRAVYDGGELPEWWDDDDLDGARKLAELDAFVRDRCPEVPEEHIEVETVPEALDRHLNQPADVNAIRSIADIQSSSVCRDWEAYFEQRARFRELISTAEDGLRPPPVAAQQAFADLGTHAVLLKARVAKTPGFWYLNDAWRHLAAIDVAVWKHFTEGEPLTVQQIIDLEVNAAPLIEAYAACDDVDQSLTTVALPPLLN